MGVHCVSLGVGAPGHWWQRPQEITLCALAQRLPFWHQDLTLPKCLQVPVLECFESHNNRVGTQPNHHDRLYKLALRSQPPLNTPLDMALPTRGTRSSTSPSRRSLHKLLHPRHLPGAEVRGQRSYSPAEKRPQTHKVDMAQKYVSDEG